MKMVFEETRQTLVRRLLESRNAKGFWEGELASSALSTATAVLAFSLEGTRASGTGNPEIPCRDLVGRGLVWLMQTQNRDGGWGDTSVSASNISTTSLCWSALTLAGAGSVAFANAVAAAESWLRAEAGSLDPDPLARAIAGRYGKDQTFSVPILTVLAVAGRLGAGMDGWGRVPQLPFELAAFPQRVFRWLSIPVVSYALPALIAIGQVRDHHRPSRNPITRLLRQLARARTLDVLDHIQPPSGGFLEAIPLTSFVVLSLLSSGREDHPVARRGLKFLARSARADGSWPIDTNLATWVTTLSVNAIATDPALGDLMRIEDRRQICNWLLGQQYRERHSYTGAAPGGWAWTDLSGGVPDADDTAGALVALHRLGILEDRVRAAVRAGITWLLGLQNADGGMPTFCRGWGRLPFDRSSPDLTAHALLAWATWREELPAGLGHRVTRGVLAALAFLKRTQRAEGAWVPLWFGNERAPGEENPTYGTARVLLALRVLERLEWTGVSTMTQRAERWLIDAQNTDGGWGGDKRVASSIEETGLAVQALAGTAEYQAALQRGLDWLVERTDCGRSTPPSPIGFYFAKLWYFEKLYPLIFAAGGICQAIRA